MKKLIPLIILVLIIGALVFGYAMLSNKGKSAGESTTDEITTLVLIVEQNPSDVTAISYTNEDSTFSFVLENGVWQNEDDPTMPINQALVGEMATALSSIRAVRKIADDKSAAADYGLDNPPLTLTVKYVDSSGERTVVYSVGTADPFGKTHYFTLDTENAIYTINTAFAAIFDYTQEELVVLDTMPPIEKSEVSALTLSTAEWERKLSRKENTAEDGWILTDGEQIDIEIDNEAAELLLSRILSLDLSRCVNYHAQPQDLAEFFLDEPLHTLTISYSREKSISDAVTGTSQGSVKLDYTYTIDVGIIDGNKAYVRIQDSDMIFLSDISEIKTIMEEYDEILS